MTSTIRALGFLLVVIALMGCDLGGNSGSETTNGLAGKVMDAKGEPVVGARMRLLSDDFDPISDTAVAETLTDSKGEYALSGVAPGSYNVEMNEAGRGLMALVQDVMIPVSGEALANGVLLEPGNVTVRIHDFASTGDMGYVFVPGTGALVAIGAEAIARGEVTLNRVPAGIMDSLVLVLSRSANRQAFTLARELEVAAGGQTTIAPFSTWNYSRKIHLDTEAIGLVQDVTDFPLLVRLTSGDSIFDQAALQGDDLRFTDAADHPLAYQIERWDGVTRQAEIWVRLDIVRGNAADQAIQMHWGKPGAMSVFAESVVFDSLSSYATVYHLAEAPTAAIGGYRDATSEGNHATSVSSFANSQVNGVIGFARNFSGTPTSADNALTAAVPKGLSGNSSFTVSFWMRCRMIPQRQGILDFGSFDLHKDMHFLLRPDTSIQFGAYDKNLTGADPAPWQSVFKIPSLPDRWTHLATVYDASRSSLEVYVNGSRVDSLQVPALAIDAMGGLRIGKPIWTDVVGALEYPFNGDLDEIRFESRATTPERIRLDYLTQKP